MNNSSLIFSLSLLIFVWLSDQLEFDENFDMNDVENRVCDQGCEARQVRMSTYKETFDELYRCSTCKQMFDLCVKYRSCQSNCVPEMTVLPYEQAREFARRIRAPLNPCLELISACNYESPDAYEALRTPNPFLFI